MSKQKSITVTVIIAVLAGIAIFAAYQMWRTAFIIITSALSAAGFYSVAAFLCDWLEADTFKPEEAVEPLEIKPAQLPEEPDLGADFTTTFDEIRREMEVDR